MAKIILRIEANNIGPHSKLKSELKNESSKIGLYANNGSGKTFLSRAFRLYSNSIDGEINTYDINKMLSFGSDNASFKFDVENQESGEINSFSYNLSKGDSKLSVTQKSKYIFHVFNKDYVDQNLEACGYSPNGEIEGFILGKDKIDLSKEEEELKRKQIEIQKLKTQIAFSIDSATSELKALGIRAITAEFKQINFESVTKEDITIYEGEVYEVLKDKHEKLKSMPADLPDATNFDLDPSDDLLEKIKAYLSNKINKSTIAEEFKQKIKDKQLFIEQGVKLISNNQYPFCEQELSKNAVELIDLYNHYLDDAEAQEAKKAEKFIDELNYFYRSFERAYSSFNEGLTKFIQIRDYIPSVNSLDLIEVSKYTEIKDEIENLKKLLSKKSLDVSQVFGEDLYAGKIRKILEFHQNLEQIKQENKINIEIVNSKKRKIQQEKSSLNKQLCVAKLYELKKNLSKNITNYHQIKTEMDELETDIRTKRNKFKKERKNEVMRTFIECLERV